MVINKDFFKHNSQRFRATYLILINVNSQMQSSRQCNDNEVNFDTFEDR